MTECIINALAFLFYCFIKKFLREHGGELARNSMEQVMIMSLSTMSNKSFVIQNTKIAKHIVTINKHLF